MDQEELRRLQKTKPHFAEKGGAHLLNEYMKDRVSGVSVSVARLRTLTATPWAHGLHKVCPQCWTPGSMEGSFRGGVQEAGTGAPVEAGPRPLCTRCTQGWAKRPPPEAPAHPLLYESDITLKNLQTVLTLVFHFHIGIYHFSVI